MTVKLTCGKGAENLSADDKLVIDKITSEYEDRIIKHGEKIDFFEKLADHIKRNLAKIKYYVIGK